MQYFKLIKLDESPFIAIGFAAKDIEDLEAKGLKDSPLIVSQQDAPSYRYGVCLKMIDDEGKLIDTPPEIIEAGRIKDLADQAIVAKQLVVTDADIEARAEIAKGFDFDGKKFSLSQNAQRNWQGLYLKHLGGLFVDMEISTFDDGVYTLTVEKIANFIIAGSKIIEDAIKISRDKKNAI